MNNPISRVNNQLFHYSEQYLDFLKIAIPGTDIHVLTVDGEDGPRGIFPLALIHSQQYGTVINSLPFFGSHGGPIAENYETRRILITDFQDFIKEINPCAVTVIENPFLPLEDSLIAEMGLDVVDDRIGQFTRLPASMADFHLKTRNAIRKGQKLKLIIERRLDSEAWVWMQKVHENSILALGGVPKSMSVFNALQASFGDAAELWVGTLDGKPVSGLVIIRYQKIVEYFTPVVEENYRESQALSALIFHVMQQAAESGAALWNWGGTWRSQEGVYRFKNRWGAFDRSYRYFNYVRDQALLECPRSELFMAFPNFYLFRY